MTTAECDQLDGCCTVHSPCFRPENEDLDDGSACLGWPCPACRHCGQLPDLDGDHSCPCPFPDNQCTDHPLVAV